MKHSPQLCQCGSYYTVYQYCQYKQNIIKYLLDHKALLFQHPEHISMIDSHHHASTYLHRQVLE